MAQQHRFTRLGSALANAWRAARSTLSAPPSVAASTPRRDQPRMVRRNFNGAVEDNLTASFRADSQPLNLVLEQQLPTMRGRSRNLAKNNGYVRKFLRMVQNNVVGPQGFALSVPCLRDNGTIDEADRALCEKVFARWAKRGVCDVTGRLSFVQLQRLLALICARDGEAIVRRVKNDRSTNAFRYALQVIDPVLLDHSYRADFNDGRRIRMGVEVNAMGKPIAYHFRTDVESSYGTRRIRVDASEVWHLFLQEEPDQVRGYPWVHAAMRNLNDTGGFIEAAVIAARVGASNMGFYVPPSDQPGGTGQLADEAIKTEKADGTEGVELVKDATPGTFEELPPGYDFKEFKPTYPHQNFDSFIKAMLRGVSSGLGADYPTLANDLEGVNYSSIRSGKLETQDEWMCLQGWFREGLLDPLWPEWLDQAFLSGQMAGLPVSKFDKYNVAVWQGRRWPWVDPQKDMQAKVLELENCLTSYSAVMREMGRDPEATWRELEKDKKRLADLLPKPSAPASPAGASVSEPAKEPVDE